MEETPKKIKNINYRKFLDHGIITTLDIRHVKAAIENVSGKYSIEAKMLIVALYYTGARPIEVLKLKGKDIGKNGTYITISLVGAKRGLPRTLNIPMKKPYIKELYDYSKSIFEDMFMFYHFQSHYIRAVRSKSGQFSEREEITDKLRYYFKKWFDNVLEGGVNPYYLRHNRFSKLAQEGATETQLRLLKGAKTSESIIPYIHMSTETSKKVGRKID